MTCQKCNTDCQQLGGAYVEGGETFYFCSYCSQAIEKLGTGNIKNFMNDDNLEMIENRILKSIIEARMRRSVQK